MATGLLHCSVASTRDESATAMFDDVDEDSLQDTFGNNKEADMENYYDEDYNDEEAFSQVTSSVAKRACRRKCIILACRRVTSSRSRITCIRRCFSLCGGVRLCRCPPPSNRPPSNYVG